jgi:hypothetical protein
MDPIRRQERILFGVENGRPAAAGSHRWNVTSVYLQDLQRCGVRHGGPTMSDSSFALPLPPAGPFWSPASALPGAIKDCFGSVCPATPRAALL